ncbi:MAG: hypothetical protein GY716_06570 [bacterium]|nr:hypothetical protein [bacterium]
MRFRVSFVGLLLAAFATGSTSAQVLRQVTDVRVDEFAYSATAIDDAGTTIFVASTADPFGDNPTHIRRIVAFDVATGTGQAVGDVAATWVSVDDDATWLAFGSTDDPLGQNADGSSEIFLMRTDGTDLVQLTQIAGSADGSVGFPTISGNGNRVLFSGDFDPLGTNPDRELQQFVIDADGTGLVQLTTGSAYHLGNSISDDGQRIVFASTGDPTGENPNGGVQVFAINADASGLRQLTSAGHAYGPRLSGDGKTVAFEDPGAPGEIYVIPFDGGPSTLVAEGGDPSITDDGKWVYFSDRDGVGGPVELWRSNLGNGASRERVSPGTGAWSQGAVVAGGGTQVVFNTTGSAYPGESNPDGDEELMVITVDGTVWRQLTANAPDVKTTRPDLALGGERVVFYSDADLDGTNPDRDGGLFVVDADGTDPFRVAPTEDWHLPSSISGDGGAIAFTGYVDHPTGGWYDRAFVVDADGTGLTALSPPWFPAAWIPQISATGDRVVFLSHTDPSPALVEIYSVNADGSGLVLLRTGLQHWTNPRISGDGQWVVYSADGELYRARSDGSFVEPIPVPDTSLHWPDISYDGELVAFFSPGDLTGQNPELNPEVFLYDAATQAFHQITFTSSPSSVGIPRISGDGAWIYFLGRGPEYDAPVRYAPLRVHVETGTIQRVSGLCRDGLVSGWGLDSFLSIEPDFDGQRAVFSTGLDCAGINPDDNPEVFIVDFESPARISVGAQSPTLVSWDAEPRPQSYDVIRGDVADLASLPGGTVDLGSVVCLEDDSLDTDTQGFEDAISPTPGQTFFFLYRGQEWTGGDPGSWGEGSAGGERVASAGACPAS